MTSQAGRAELANRYALVKVGITGRQPMQPAIWIEESGGSEPITQSESLRKHALAVEACMRLTFDIQRLDTKKEV